MGAQAFCCQSLEGLRWQPDVFEYGGFTGEGQDPADLQHGIASPQIQGACNI